MIAKRAELHARSAGGCGGRKAILCDVTGRTIKIHSRSDLAAVSVLIPPLMVADSSVRVPCSRPNGGEAHSRAHAGASRACAAIPRHIRGGAVLVSGVLSTGPIQIRSPFECPLLSCMRLRNDCKTCRAPRKIRWRLWRTQSNTL